ncbi:hypothetical protein HYX12_00860 [Candidatus Woesearchaeota archaeon]|nr:hypothetical protein [Candidatus Woesearchaeota archaeon]
MITDRLSVQTKIDEQAGGEDISVKLDEKLVFAGTRYDTEGYSSVFWEVDPSKSKEDYLGILVTFYEALKTGGFKDRGARGLPLGIIIDEATEKPLPLEYLVGDQSRLLQHPKWGDFALFRVDTPYAAFTMEDFSGDGWKPETGKISVISHNDLSVPVAQLIAETTKYSASADRLQPILAERVYTFKR